MQLCVADIGLAYVGLELLKWRSLYLGLGGCPEWLAGILWLHRITGLLFMNQIGYYLLFSVLKRTRLASGLIG
jgi:hypothetical protein